MKTPSGSFFRFLNKQLTSVLFVNLTFTGLDLLGLYFPMHSIESIGVFLANSFLSSAVAPSVTVASTDIILVFVS